MVFMDLIHIFIRLILDFKQLMNFLSLNILNFHLQHIRLKIFINFH